MAGVTVIDPGPIPYRALPCAGDPVLEADLSQAWFGGAGAASEFRLVEVPVEAFGRAPDPESFLLDGDESGWELCLGLADAFRAGEEVPAVVARRHEDGWEIIDGWHRLAAAAHAGAGALRAYELLG